MAMYDAFVSCWRTKYDFWVARPFTRAPGLVTVIPTPNFPSYTSGHSTISAAAAEVLSAAFPDQATFYHEQAAEAALSRFWGGIHFTHDNEQGLLVGARVGEKAAARFRAEGRHDDAHLVATETR
jgi:membrane-associated phospholipid phosphatase